MKEKLKNLDQKKIYFVAGGFILAIIILLLGGAFIYNKFFYKRSYKEIEEIMVKSAQNYLSKDKDKLPKNYNDEITLTDSDLVSAKEMKSIQEYLKDEESPCTGNVVITNINGKYRYTPSLDCKDNYQTVKFIDYIKKTVPVITTGNGLYQSNEDLIYRGDNVNNFLKLNNQNYRIVKFQNNQTVIISAEKTESIPWDDRYNVQKNSTMGINDYSVSRIKEYLEKLYKGNKLLTEEDKLLTVAHNLEIGKREGNATDKTGALEKSAIIENQFIGLLPLYDFLNASLDQDCTTSNSRSCVNYNYLSKYNYPWWSMSATSKNTYQVYRIKSKGSAIETSASNSSYVRAVLHLSKDTLYVSGTGSEDDPYIIK